MNTGEHDDYNKCVAPVSSLAQAQPLSTSELTGGWTQAQPSYLSNQVCSACEHQLGSGLLNHLTFKHLSISRIYFINTFYKQTLLFMWQHILSDKVISKLLAFVFY